MYTIGYIRVKITKLDNYDTYCTVSENYLLDKNKHNDQDIKCDSRAKNFISRHCLGGKRASSI